MDIMEFTGKLEDLIDRTEASYIELIGALELAKQRLIMEAQEDEDEPLEDDEDEEDEEDDEEDDEDEDEDEDDEDDRF